MQGRARLCSKNHETLPEGRPSMLVYSLCSSSRAGSSYIIAGESGVLLIDCGSTNRHLRMCLAMLGLSFGDIRACLLTHSHPDHTRSLGFLQRTGIPVLARKETARVLSSSGRSWGHITEIGKRAAITGELSVEAWDLPHYADDGSTAFILSSDGESCAIITDVGDVPPALVDRARGVTCVLCESNHDEAHVQSGVPFEGGRHRPLWILHERSLGPKGHLSNEQAADALAAMVTGQTRLVLLCHLSEDYNRPDVAKGTVERRLRLSGWRGPVLSAPADRIIGPLRTARDAR